jgi:hypothetical protein
MAKEKLTLTTPIVGATTTSYKVRLLEVDVNAKTVLIGLKPDDGVAFNHVYTDALPLIAAINNGAWAIAGKTLQEAILDKLVSDGVLVGTVVEG